MTDAYQKLCAGMSELKLTAMRLNVDAVIDRVNSGQEGFVDGLAELIQAQVADSRKRRISSVAAAAHFPSQKTFDGFDF